ncbi:hypothetical protein BKA93DRAFT_829090 [Sparassis latifolia]
MAQNIVSELCEYLSRDAAEDGCEIFEQVDTVVVSDDIQMNQQIYCKDSKGIMTQMGFIRSLGPGSQRPHRRLKHLFFQDDTNWSTEDEDAYRVSRFKPPWHRTTDFNGISDLSFSRERPTIDKIIGDILEPYWQSCCCNLARTKPVNIIILTNNAAKDPTPLKRVIFNSISDIWLYKTKPYQVSLYFFQVGNPDSLKDQDDQTTTFLKDLDDNLRDDILAWPLRPKMEIERLDEEYTGLMNAISETSKEKGLGMFDIVNSTTLENLESGTLTAQGITKVVIEGLRKLMD